METDARAAGPVRLDRVLGILLSAAPLLIAVPVLYGLGASLADLFRTSHPYFLDSSGVNLDGLAIRLGQPLYQDPAAGYTPNAYTPLLALLTAGLDLVGVWSGWALLIIILSAIGLMCLVGWMAYVPSGSDRLARAVALAGAVGMAGLAFWLVAFVPVNLLYSGRADHLSWLLGLAGLVLAPAAARGRGRAAGLMLVLLTLSVWTKQTGALAAAVGLGWLFLGAARGRCSWRWALTLSFVFVAVNGALWLALGILTDGWAKAFILDYPSAHGNAIGFGESLSHLAKDALFPAALAAVLWAPLAWRRLRADERPSEIAGEAGAARVAACGPLLAFIALSVPFAARTAQAVGSVDNHYTGLTWALTLVAAAAFGLDQRRRGSALVAAAAIVALFAATESSSVVDHLARHRIFVAAKSYRAHISEEPPALRALAERRAVYHPVYADVTTLGGRKPYPADDSIWGLYIAGAQPRYVTDALLKRRFDVVYAFEDRGFNQGSRGGEVEDAYWWKLNEVIRRKYRPARVSPALDAARTVPLYYGRYVSPGIFVRRSGPDPAPWLDTCFGPFRLRATTWDIRRGGGLWCRLPRGGQSMRMVATPGIVSELRSRQAGEPTGFMGITVRADGALAEMAPEGPSPAWTLRVRRAPDGQAEITLRMRDASPSALRQRTWPVRLRLVTGSAARLSRSDRFVVAQLPPGREHLVLRASVTSRASFDLGDLRLPGH